jgi:hypothetical protein
MRSTSLFFGASLLFFFQASTLHAEDKKAKSKEVSVDSFFDPPPEKKASDDELKKAAAGLGAKDALDTLAPKAAVVDDAAAVKLEGVFAAETIVVDKKLGCQPGGKKRERVTYWTFDELPDVGVPFGVCLSMSSTAGRQMALTVTLLDPRNGRIARAQDVVDFTGYTGRRDQIIEFPAITFKVAGPHVFLVELDGKEVGRLPIFDVRLMTDGSPTGIGGEPLSSSSTSSSPVKQP